MIHYPSSHNFHLSHLIFTQMFHQMTSYILSQTYMILLTLKMLVATIDALGHFETE